MKTDDVFPSRFVKATDIGDKEVTVTINRVVTEILGIDEKPVAYFKNAEKGLVLNRTNWDRIAFAAGSDDSDDWPGVRVTLFTELVTFNGRTAPAIRVKPTAKRGAPPQQKAAAKPPLSEALNDEIGF
jgi:hypothetical protein